MIVDYEITICFKVTQETDTLNNLKSDREYAEDIAHFVCDEIATAGGVVSYSIQDSCVDVTGILNEDVKEKKVVNVSEKIYKDFMKKC